MKNRDDFPREPLNEEQKKVLKYLKSMVPKSKEEIMRDLISDYRDLLVYICQSHIYNMPARTYKVYISEKCALAQMKKVQDFLDSEPSSAAFKK